MNSILKIYLSVLLLFMTTQANALDRDNGKKLHDTNCLRCHTASHYTRIDRKIEDYEKLHERVQLCETMLELMWFDEEIEDVTHYLNEVFYQFSLKK